MQKPLKPKLFKRHNVWHCQYRDKLTIGHTPKQAYSAMRYIRMGAPSVLIDDSLIYKD